LSGSLLLAPMQDVTDLAFWRLLERRAGADCYLTEYIRVYPHSRIDPHIERQILQNDTGRPLVAQIAGEDIPSLVKIAQELQRLPVAGIDLNLGCPAQVVCRKNVGGALLKDPAKVEEILGALRPAIKIPFSVKCRLGYADSSSFEHLLELFNQYRLDWVTIHGRTVRQGYGGQANWDAIMQAARLLNCPTIGNGDISCPQTAARILTDSPLAGLMIGRGAVRNPWLFSQIRQVLEGKEPLLPTGRQLMEYLRELRQVTDLGPLSRGERFHVERVKKFLNFIGEGVGADFLHAVRRASSWSQMESIWARFLDHDRPMPLIPPRKPPAGENSPATLPEKH